MEDGSYTAQDHGGRIVSKEDTPNPNDSTDQPLAEKLDRILHTFVTSLVPYPTGKVKHTDYYEAEQKARAAILAAFAAELRAIVPEKDEREDWDEEQMQEYVEY